MSELKDYDIMDIEAMDDERLEKSESGKIQVTRVYIKSEADKVIAEKNEKIEFEKQCLEKIPPSDLREICDRAFFITKAAFADVRNIYFTYCNECLKFYSKKHLAKVPCITNCFEMTELCSSHFLEKKQKELCQEYLDKHKPKLDLKDFARI